MKTKKDRNTNKVLSPDTGYNCPTWKSIDPPSYQSCCASLLGTLQWVCILICICICPLIKKRWFNSLLMEWVRLELEWVCLDFHLYLYLSSDSEATIPLNILLEFWQPGKVDSENLLCLKNIIRVLRTQPIYCVKVLRICKLLKCSVLLVICEGCTIITCPTTTWLIANFLPG